ncbi:hypothetical protein GN956_G7347 [Arapaima gigas]
MKPHKLSVTKRFTKPALFGAVLLGLATAFLNRHVFLRDVEEIRAEEQARSEEKLREVLERRQRQFVELQQKKGERGR